MPFDKVNRPVPGPEAFRERGDAALLSQAALLLMLGVKLRGDDHALRARAAAAGSEEFVEAIPAEDLAEFPVPPLRSTGERIGVERVRARLTSRYGRRFLKDLPGTEQMPTLPEALTDLVTRLYTDPTLHNAAELLEACLRHPDELPRVAAAVSYFELSAQPSRLLKVIQRGTQSDDELVRDVAATALSRIAPEHRALVKITKSKATASGSKSSHTSLLIHGTWARHSAWWQPNGDFHSYLLTQVRPDLYKDPDRFEWSGGWSDNARALGAVDLRTWIDSHGLNGLDLFTHSHGGSIAMLASQGGLGIGKLVLLSCPVHIPKYMPDFTRVTRVVSIRVHLDLVILADGGGQRFRHPNIDEHVLPVWFDHSATHDPNTWQTYNVPSML